MIHLRCRNKMERDYNKLNLDPSDVRKRALKGTESNSIITPLESGPAESTRRRSQEVGMREAHSEEPSNRASGQDSGSLMPPPFFPDPSPSISSINYSLPSSNPFEPPRIPQVKHVFPFRGVFDSTDLCFICRAPSDLRISREARANFLLKRKIFIYSYSKICPEHINNGRVNQELYNSIETVGLTSMTSIADMSYLLLEVCDEGNRDTIDFGRNNSLGDSRMKVLTGLSRDNFEKLCDFLWIGTCDTIPRKSLGLYLMRLRLGLSLRGLGAMFNLPLATISRYLKTTRQQLTQDFVPLFLGFNAITHQEASSMHTRTLAKELFGKNMDSVVLIMDGTYLYIEKSNHFALRRPTYSMHKGRHLVKPFTVCTTDGYIVDMLGPFCARNNDSTILNSLIMEAGSLMREWLTGDDCLILDRGFRDSLTLLDWMNIRSETPCFMGTNQKQPDPKSANKSRQVTSIRWAVEAVHARIKKFKYFSNVISNNNIPTLKQDLNVVCALINSFKKPVIIDTHLDENLAFSMRERSLIDYSDLPERNSSRYEEENLTQGVGQRIGFPKLTIFEIYSFTVGRYQIKLARSYIRDSFLERENACISLADSADGDKIVKVKMASSHSSKTRYNIFIEFVVGGIFPTGIKRYYCTCKSGTRTSGTCGHVAAVMVFLSGLSDDQSHKNYKAYLLDATDINFDDLECSNDDDDQVEPIGEVHDPEEYLNII